MLSWLSCVSLDSPLHAASDEGKDVLAHKTGRPAGGLSTVGPRGD